MSRLVYAMVTFVPEKRTKTKEDEHHWIIMFAEGGKAYAYLFRSVPYMTAVIRKFHNDEGGWPYRMWVIVDGEIQKVEIA